MDFKTFLKTRRTALNLSQAEIAEGLSERGQETSPARVGHWETGRNKPPLETPRFREALATVLQMDMNSMMIQLGFVVLETERSTEAQHAASIVDNLPPIARELAIDFLNLLEKRFAVKSHVGDEH